MRAHASEISRSASTRAASTSSGFGLRPLDDERLGWLDIRPPRKVVNFGHAHQFKRMDGPHEVRERRGNWLIERNVVHGSSSQIENHAALCVVCREHFISPAPETRGAAARNVLTMYTLYIKIQDNTRVYVK
jgi:hypothetical protein